MTKVQHTRWLTVIQGPLAGSTFALSGQVVIGRGLDVDIQIDDEGVSRHHACIALDDSSKSLLVDLNSTNGTWLEEQSVEKRVLKSGDRFSIGPAAFAYREGAPHEVVTGEHELQPSDTIEITVDEMGQNMGVSAPPPVPAGSARGPIDRMATVAHIGSMVRTLKDLAQEKAVGGAAGCGHRLHEIAIAANWQYCPACGEQIEPAKGS